MAKTGGVLLATLFRFWSYRTFVFQPAPAGTRPDTWHSIPRDEWDTMAEMDPVAELAESVSELEESEPPAGHRAARSHASRPTGRPRAERRRPGGPGPGGAPPRSAPASAGSPSTGNWTRNWPPDCRAPAADRRAAGPPTATPPHPPTRRPAADPRRRARRPAGCAGQAVGSRSGLPSCMSARMSRISPSPSECLSWWASTSS